MSIVQDAAQKLMQTAIGLAPARWLPGGTPDPLAKKHGLIGAPISRIDGPLKVAGRARFAAEVAADGLLYTGWVFATIARGRIAEIDTSEAEAAPGVALVMTYRNAPRMKAPALFGTAPDAAGPSDLPIMQDATVRWNGQPVAVILADTQEQADHAATLVRVTYVAEPAVTSFAEAKAKAHPPQTVLGEPPVLEIGDAEQALGEAEVRIDLTFTTPRYNHNAIELHACTVMWEGEDRLVIHDASQLVTATAATVSGVFGLKQEQVRVISPYVGGGFGGKCLWWHQILGAAASKLAGRPVRAGLSREGVFRIVGGRTTTEQRVALGARADGTLTALIHSGVAAMTTHNNCPEQFSFPARHLYAAENIRLAQDVADMDMIANTFMRAPGESVGTFALECAIDELAEALSLDPIALRHKLEPAKDPTSGHEFSARHLLEAYETGAERFGWSERSATPASRREGEWLVGMGVATGTYPYYRMPGGSARITLRADGAVVAAAAHEMGMGTATVQAQVSAERLGLPYEAVRFEHGDTDLPASPVAGGSNQTAAIGAAVIAAHEELVKQLIKLAGNDSPLAGLSADEVEGRDGGLVKHDDPTRHESYASILARAGRDALIVEAAAPPPLETKKWSMHSTSAVFAEVRVNVVTGEVRVSRLLGSFDCGRILNAKTATSQFRGGMIMGIGLALTEETLFDERSGRIMNPSLAEYHVPVHMDVPEIDVLWTDIADPHTPMGARGIGEIGITGVGAAIANAIYNATGVRVRDLPITLDKLLDKLPAA